MTINTTKEETVIDRITQIKDFPEISLLGVTEQFDTSVKLIQQEGEVYLYEFNLSSDGVASPNKITLRWRIPSINIKGVWTSASLHDKRLQYDWELNHLHSRVSVDAPVVSVFGHDDLNVITFACSDAINKMEMNALLREEDNHLYCHLSFFTERQQDIDNYKAQIRVDKRTISYANSLQEISDWWTTFDVLKPSPVPALARVPLYSTWYNFHQSLDTKTLLDECKLAREIGYELIILDDGWQTMDGNRGYDYCGDWQPERIPDMRKFVADLHQIDMKVGLWFSVPFCGEKSKAYQHFKGKFLTENHRWAPVFDPRYPEVREYLINVYKEALVNYNLDAFKLDFIDDFMAYPETVLTKEDGRDYANVNEAVDRLMTDVMETLRAIKKDIAIEFRQKYIGPTMRKFGNMFRAFDCPNDPVSNRIRITDVKLLCGDTAVHSDMLTWHAEESVELAAFQVLNAFWGVPQMSIMLRDANPQHLKMIKFYTQYWIDNATILLDGKFTPYNPLANYPVLKSELNKQTIIGVFDDAVVEHDLQNSTDVLNVKISEKVVVRNTGIAGKFEVTIWDCQGNHSETSIEDLPTGLLDFTIPTAGMIKIKRQ